MKQDYCKRILSCLGPAIFVHLLCTNGFASDAPPWRGIYDEVLLWINFFILVVVFVKFAKNPLVKALQGVKNKIAEELGNLKKELGHQKNNLDTEHNKMSAIQKHLDEIRNQIIAMGEKEKEDIIEKAKLAAEKMVNDAKRYADLQIERARKQLSDEMVDLAVYMVEKRISKEISAEDQEKIVGDFLLSLEATKPHLN